MARLPTTLTLAALLSVAFCTTPGVADAGSDGELQRLRAAFRAHTGASLVFRARDLPRGSYYDRMPVLDRADRLRAARIAVRESAKYPRGYLGRMGLSTVGIFDALVADEGDGYRPYNKQWQGYLYYGLWNGRDAVVAAYYSDGQLPLTLHHEFFHHVDGTRAGKTDYDAHFRSDDRRFKAAVAGKRPYPAPRIPADDLVRLREKAQGSVLRTTVSGYAAKSAGEDQAETARHVMTNLADSLLQVVDQPGLAGSQRILHVMRQYRRALAGGPEIGWFVDVALGRAPRIDSLAYLRERIASRERRLRERLRPRRGDRVFAVWGREDADGVNRTLRADIDRFADDARTLAGLAAPIRGSQSALREALMRNLRLLARYQRYIAERWHITRGTQERFDLARRATIAALPTGDRALAGRLEAASYAGLARGIDARGRVIGALRARRHDNPHLQKVDAAIADSRLRAAIRRVQPACVRFDNGSGVNLAPEGLVLTAAHVVDRKGAKKRVRFPDGQAFRGTVVAIDHKLDLALVRLRGAASLPHARIAEVAPQRGATVVAIGQPGKRTPGGEATGYQPWHVSQGQIRGFLANRLGDQSLGRTKHDAWTYWGHSGSPLFDEDGAIVAMHNSWDPETAMRHAVTWEAIAHFLEESGVP